MASFNIQLSIGAAFVLIVVALTLSSIALYYALDNNKNFQHDDPDDEASYVAMYNKDKGFHYNEHAKYVNSSSSASSRVLLDAGDHKTFSAVHGVAFQASHSNDQRAISSNVPRGINVLKHFDHFLVKPPIFDMDGTSDADASSPTVGWNKIFHNVSFIDVCIIRSEGAPYARVMASLHMEFTTVPSVEDDEQVRSDEAVLPLIDMSQSTVNPPYQRNDTDLANAPYNGLPRGPNSFSSLPWFQHPALVPRTGTCSKVQGAITTSLGGASDGDALTDANHYHLEVNNFTMQVYAGGITRAQDADLSIKSSEDVRYDVRFASTVAGAPVMVHADVVYLTNEAAFASPTS